MQKTACFLLLSVLLFADTNVSARFLKRQLRRLPQKAGSRALLRHTTGNLLTTAVSKKTVELFLNDCSQQAASLQRFNKQEAQRSIFFVEAQNPSLFPEFHAATGFVFKTQYKGKTEIWGAMAQHVVDLMDENISATFFYNGKKYTFPGTVVQQGNRYRADIALIRFKATPTFLSVVHPLTLAEENAKVSSKATSYGYSASTQTFFAMEGRQVLCSGSLCGGTTTVQASQPRGGTCGSPLIDEQGFVIGIHCGTPSVASQLIFYPNFLPIEGQNIWPFFSKKDRVAHFVHAHILQDFVKAFHEKTPLWAVRWNNIEITQLYADEFIDEIESVSSWWRYSHYRADRHEPFLDEAHLERFVKPRRGSVLNIYIRGPKSIRTISFNIKTQKVEEQTIRHL